MQKTVLFQEFKDPEPANSEESGYFLEYFESQPLSLKGIKRRHLAKSARREVFESLVF